MEYRKLRVIISGGGTGGHIFPAVSIADKLRELNPETEILFVGAEGRMEMEKVPAAGYRIVGLPIAGLQRKLSLSNLIHNLSLPFKLADSMRRASTIIEEFEPDVAIGVGGYASAPLLREAEKLRVPTLIQEQNSFAGLTNKMLAKKVDSICVAYEGMERFFPADRIVMTGNPVRQNLLAPGTGKDEAAASFGLVPGKRTILVIGGSLGARSLNESILGNLQLVKQQKDVQFIWQTGKFYSKEIADELQRRGRPDNLYVADFIADMRTAYAAADLVISRAGAGSISELCLLGKPSILVPSPNVAEDHQTKNALALVQKDAAIFVADADARRTLLPQAINLATEPERLHRLAANIRRLARPNAAADIADEVIRLATQAKA